MLLQRSASIVRDPKRPQLAPIWVIAPLAGLVLFTLIVIYPHGDLVNRVLNTPAGPITNAYLTNLLRTDPHNPGLRLMLARSQIQAGEFGLVAKTLATLIQSANPEVRQEAQWLLWKADHDRFLQLKQGEERNRLVADLRRRLAVMAKESLPAEQLAHLARGAFAIGDSSLAQSLFDRLARSRSQQAHLWYEEAGREALSYSEYRASANFYLLAAGRAESLEEERRHFSNALNSYASGDLVVEGIVVAADYLERSPRLIKDTDTLVRMVELARSARRPDLADRFARHLLRQALLEQWQRSEWRLAHYGALPQKVALADESLKGGPQLPFDHRIYTLGFEAFLDNRKLDDAWKVAASAVLQAPDDPIWRERLAKVSEWSAQPQTALKNWLYLAHQINSEEAWQAVLRLAPGLFDDAALRDALHHNLEKQPGNEKLIIELSAVYERLGNPQGAIVLLEKRQLSLGSANLLQELAELAERQGNDLAALGYWRRYLAHAQAKLTVALVVRVAVLLITQGEDKEALNLLNSFSARASDNDTAFWRMTAELARQQEREDTAIAAYKRLIAGPEAEVRDFEASYNMLLETCPREAAKIAAAGWRRFGNPQLLFNALTAYANASAFDEMGKLLAELDKTRLQSLRQQPEFLRLCARYQLSRGAIAVARSDLEQALALAPENTDTQQALLWLLIESGDGVGLRRALAAWETSWKADPRLFDTLSAAYLGISRPDVALRRYLTPQLQAKQGDFLWLMNYADALEQNGEVDRAWRLRQHLLAEAAKKTPRRHWLTAAEAGEMRRIARTRLVISQRPGDAGNAVLRELLRLDRNPDGKLSENAAIVATAWLQGANEHSAVRGWLWARFARSAARPLWAEITVALAEDDRELAGRLLEKHGESLPRHDRVNAALLIGDLRRAQTEAFDTMDDQGADDTLHLQLTEALLAHSHHAGFALENRAVGGIDEREKSARWHLALTPRLTLDLALGSVARSNNESGVVIAPPDERLRTALLTWLHPDGTTRFGLESRHSFASYQPFFIEHEQRIDNRLSFTAALGHHLQTSESTALRLGGMRDRAALGMIYKPTQRDQFGLEYSAERYALQTGTEVGNGRHLQLEWKHLLRISAPDLESSVFWSNHRYHRQGEINDPTLRALLTADFGPATLPTGSYFLPENFRYYGIRLSTNTRFEREYTRAWRPYASVARTWNSFSGNGYELFAGVAGSVLGADHLHLGWSLSRGSRGAEGLTRQFGLYYRLHY